MAYTDDTILTSGKYKFTRLCRVPPDYLINLYKDRNYHDKELIEYIGTNIQRIVDRKLGKIVASQLKRVCDKIQYPTEKDAKFEINRIKNLEQENKKPVRAYQCDKCSAWHLTSISHEEWKKGNRNENE